MFSPVIQAKIFSVIGNPSSIVPLGLKDITNATGMTLGSYVTGKEEGLDRFIDEFGTEILWLMGIPFFKGVINLLGFRAQGLDYNFDARNFRNPDLIPLLKKYTPDELKKNVNKVIANEGKYRKLATGKFVAAVSLALATYISLTKFKQKYTDKNIVKNILEEYKQHQLKNGKISQAEAAKEIEEQEIESIVDDIIAEENAEEAEENNPAKPGQSIRVDLAPAKIEKSNNLQNSPAFTGAGFMKAFQDFAADPVKNMWLLDGGITTERIVDARGPQERWGYAFKESIILFFLYVAGPWLQSALEKRAKKVYNKTISFDARVIENPEFRKAYETNSLKQDLEAFEQLLDKNINPEAKDALTQKLKAQEELKIYEFIHNNKDNFVVKTAMESDMIQTYKKRKLNIGLKDIFKFSFTEDTGQIDTRKYIDIEALKDHYKKLVQLMEEYQTRKPNETTEQFFHTVKRLKRGAIINNIGIGILVLGIITPTVMVMKRLLSPDDREFCRKKEIRERLIKDGVITDYMA